MAMRACTHCGINYPTEDMFRQCPACGELTVYSTWGGAEPNWRGRMEAVAARLQQIEQEKLYEPPHVDVSRGIIEVDPDGLQWLDSREVIRAGVTVRLDEAPGGIVTIGPSTAINDDDPDENFYEVIAYSPERRAYWIKPLVVRDAP